MMKPLFTLMLLLTQLSAFATIRYVKPGGSGTIDGTSWANASPDLQLMINQSSATSIDTIFVAAGKYTPNRPADNLDTINPTNRNNAFTFTKNIRLFGGFPDTGNPAFTDRQPGNYKTILSGDIGTPDNNTDNSYHVVITVGTAITTDFVVDGFTIADGKADIANNINVNGTTVQTRAGAGWYNQNASPTIRNSVITNNRDGNGTAYGIGFYNYNGSPELLNIVFSNNGGPNSNGGAGCTYLGSPTLTNVVMQGNLASQGGGWYQEQGHTTFNNGTIAGNSAGVGGGVHVGSGNLTVNNGIIFHNIADREPGVYLSNLLPRPVVTYNHSLIQGVVARGTNLAETLDPQFVNPAAGDYRLTSTSPCINKGSNAWVRPGILTDLAGKPRIMTDTVDIGAYEYDPTLPVTIRYVKPGGAGTMNGTSWANASPDLQLMINQSSATSIDTIFVAAGKYTPNRPADNLDTINPTNRNNAFTFTKNIRLFGGFPATGSPAFTDREPGNYKTILSGDIGTPDNNTDNAYHVVITVGTAITPDFVVDGFTISDGKADLATDINVNDNVVQERKGAGWYNYNASPTIRNSVITNNRDGSGTAYGIGFYNYNGSPELLNIVFSNNGGANSRGGAGCSERGSPTLTNVVMQGNAAGRGGGWLQDTGHTTFNNATIARNSALEGGGVHVGSGNLTVNNGIISHNIADREPGVYVSKFLPPYPVVTYNHSLIQDVEANDTNLEGTKDPQFVNSTAGDYRLTSTSPCINKGNHALLPAGVLTDLAGRTRIIADTIDLGAYEYDLTLPVNISRFSAQVSGCNARLSWKAEKEYNMSHYDIERSANAREFTAAGRIQSLNQPDRIYHFDLPQSDGIYYYRLKAVEADGTFDHSRILAVSVKCTESPSMTLSPNPVIGDLTIRGGANGQLLQILDLNGKKRLQQKITGEKTSVHVQHLPSGIYHTQILSPSGTPVKTLKFVKP